MSVLNDSDLPDLFLKQTHEQLLIEQFGNPLLSSRARASIAYDCHETLSSHCKYNSETSGRRT